jgi:hypothetical protein
MRSNGKAHGSGPPGDMPDGSFCIVYEQLIYPFAAHILKPLCFSGPS